MRRIKINLNNVWCCVLLLSTLTCFADSEFALSEHFSSAQNIELHMATGQVLKNPLLHLNNGLAVHYADIISLVDLYGKVSQTISGAHNKKKQRERFLDALSTLNDSQYAKREIPKLVMVVKDELDKVLKAVQEKKDPETAYEKTSLEVGYKTNCITGGNCDKHLWWVIPGRYLMLLLTNEDHFAPHARQVYLIGHQLAIERAIKARNNNNDTYGLEQAYVFEAFASHYLSDLFAAGHARTPRAELALTLHPPIIGSLLASFMHQEENRQGVLLQNGRGDVWRAYGDYAYFKPENEENTQRLRQAMQASADEVFQAYYSGSAPCIDTTRIPGALENYAHVQHDIAPLFYWDPASKRLFRRKHIDDVYDKQWTTDWWGWSTLIALKKKRGLTPSAQTLWHQVEFLPRS